MKYTSKITNINKTDSFNTQDGKTMNKYIVNFANGHSPHIYKVGDFGYEVGTEIDYDLDQAKNKAKILSKNYEKPKSFEPKGNYSNPKDDVQKYIIRQSSLNRATDLTQGKEYDVNEILNLARIFENYVYNG